MKITVPRKPGAAIRSPQMPSGPSQKHMNLSEGDEMFNLEDAANFADYSPITLRRWIKDGDLVAYRARGKGAYRILKSDLLKILISNDTS